MKGRTLAAILLAFVSTSASAQLTGNFHLARSSFANGEPVFLYLDLMNNGPDPAELVIGDPDQPLCSGVDIVVSNDAPPGSCPMSRDSMRDRICSINGQVEKEQLQPGKTHTYRFLLNFRNDINAPGDYSVRARFLGFMIPTAFERTEATLDFHVNTDPVDSGAWKPWLDQLRSAPTSEARQEAAKVLASLAPVSLEETLLAFVDNPGLRRYAPLAFHRLNTPRSIEALAEIVKAPVTNERGDAAEYLAATNDPKWFPVLRDAAEKNPRDSVYPDYAARLGGDKMLPVLLTLAASPDKTTHLNAIAAMAAVGSSAPIPFLIDQLRSSDGDAGDRADYALQSLTHRTAIQGLLTRDQQNDYLKWSRWWLREGTTAPIYKDSECGERLPLP